MIAFYPDNSNHGYDNEKARDYLISNCGAFWLTVDINKKIVLGDINSKDRKPQTMNLDRLKLELKKRGD